MNLQSMAIGGFLLVSLAFWVIADLESNFPNIDLRKILMGQQALLLGVFLLVGSFALSFVI